MTVREYLKKHAQVLAAGRPRAAAVGAASEAVQKTRRPAATAHDFAVRTRHPDLLGLLDDFRGRDRWCVVVFDSLRYDVASEYFDCAPMVSPGYDTFEWGRRAWSGVHDDVTYVTAMTPMHGMDVQYDDPHLRELFKGYRARDHIGHVVDAWRSDWDDDIGAVPPESLTDTALEHLDADKLVVHYGQPHAPYVGEVRELGYTDGEDAEPFAGRPVDEPVWQRAQAGELGRGRLLDAYRSNFERAREASERLVDALDRPVLVTGDHGEALGEYGQFGHSRPMHPHKRIVPARLIDGEIEVIT